MALARKIDNFPRFRGKGIKLLEGFRPPESCILFIRLILSKLHR